MNHFYHHELSDPQAQRSLEDYRRTFGQDSMHKVSVTFGPYDRGWGHDIERLCVDVIMPVHNPAAMQYYIERICHQVLLGSAKGTTLVRAEEELKAAQARVEELQGKVKRAKEELS